MMFDAFYDIERFKYIHKALLNSSLVGSYNNQTLIPKTGVFLSKDKNVYIDTSDGVNEDLQIYEYCGRIKKVINDCKGKPFIFFKSAYSSTWSKNIVDLAEKNNGKVIPFFKWSFNNSFYNSLLGKRKDVLLRHKSTKKEYDVGVFFHDKPYRYPKPSSFDDLISHSDHSKFNIAGMSSDTGYYEINTRKDLIEKLKKSPFKLLHSGDTYSEYINNSFKCKIIINPPGIGEYTSRMVDQTYLGNCVILRKNTYDNGYTWKNHIKEIDFNSKDWIDNLSKTIKNYKDYQAKCRNYYDNFWTPKAIANYLKAHINE